MKLCEDCGEPARWKTSEGIWLCDGDYDALIEASWIEEDDYALQKDPDQ